MLAADAEAVSGRIFNVAASSPVSVNDVADTIGKILGKEVTKAHAPPRAGDIRDSWADITAARDALAWEPSVGLEEGLQRTIESLVD
jgi:UDP-glucose 4-epimerase